MIMFEHDNPYNYGCCCDPCRAMWSSYQRAAAQNAQQMLAYDNQNYNTQGLAQLGSCHAQPMPPVPPPKPWMEGWRESAAEWDKIP